MQLAYDDETNSFQFMIENPCEIDADIEVDIQLEGGLNQFKRAYSIAKFMIATSSSMIGALYEAAEGFELSQVRKNLRNAIKEAEEFQAETRDEVESGKMPESFFAMIDETVTATCTAGRKYLRSNREKILDLLCMTEIIIKGNNGIANFSLPHIGDALVSIEFSLTAPVDEMIDSAMADKVNAVTLH